ncbi:MAG: phasin family protein [Pseudomonadota bacterium]
MFPLTQQFSSTAKAQLEAQFKILQSLTTSALAGTEQILALQLSTSKAALENSTAAARQLIASQSTGEFFSLSANQTQPGIEQAMAYGRQLFGIASGTQAALLTAAKARLPAATHEAAAPTADTSVSAASATLVDAAPAHTATAAVTLTSVPTPAAPHDAPAEAAPSSAPADSEARAPGASILPLTAVEAVDAVEAFDIPAAGPAVSAVAEAVATLIDQPALAAAHPVAALVAAPTVELAPGLKPAGEAPVFKSSGPSVKPGVAGNASKQNRGLKK